MINQHLFKNKSITVVGLGRSGFACAKLLYDIGARVSITDKNDNHQVMSRAHQLPSAIRQELGKHTLQFIRKSDLIVVSPGVDGRSQPIFWSKEFGIPVIGEIECAWRLCPAQIIAVTGTNGKTTTTTLVGRVLEAAGKRTFILGNIGNPFSAQVSNIESNDFVSLEISSFQLETITSFKPKISVILNFTPDHLDRYPNASEYFSVKSRIFMNQNASDYLVLNRDDLLVRELAKKSKAKVVYFDGNMHSNLNFAAVEAVASILRIDADLCKEVFRIFRGLPHRLERTAEIKSREFINDSKATNPEATAFALRNISRPIILIAGGRDKGLDFTIIKDLICQRTKGLILLGEARDKIKQVFKTQLPVKDASDLTQAVKFAFTQSQAGDTILLSPMCSSFDMFRDYEHRGEVFKEAVRRLKQEYATDKD
jgi:UDP-N-acetylmuramoylalanine--D-glutamate ligase